MEKAKLVLFRMDHDEHKDLKVFCAVHGYTMQDFINESIRLHKKKWKA